LLRCLEIKFRDTAFLGRSNIHQSLSYSSRRQHGPRFVAISLPVIPIATTASYFDLLPPPPPPGHDLLFPRRPKMLARTGAAIANRAPARLKECRVDDDGALLLCRQYFRHCHQHRYCSSYRNASFVVVVVVVVYDCCRCCASLLDFFPFARWLV
jgi:hypothetical protein